jgi:[ribosomal protein S5]-alanine N-acetyltransferase
MLLKIHPMLPSPTIPRSFAEVTLQTERLTLRPLAAPDAPALFTIFSEPQVARYLSEPAWAHIDIAHARIARDIDALAQVKYLCLGIFLSSDDALLGECWLFNFKDQCRRAEVGYSLGLNAWGRGYMHEALVALLSFGFGQLKLNRIEADIDPRNSASAKSLERLGFQHEGHLRERWIVEGEVSDSGIYGLLERDWQQLFASGTL